MKFHNFVLVQEGSKLGINFRFLFKVCFPPAAGILLLRRIKLTINVSRLHLNGFLTIATEEFSGYSYKINKLNTTL